MARLSQIRNLKRNRKGFSTVISAIFMVLAVMFLFFNVFMFTQNEDAKLQNAISQSTQLDADRNTEHLTIQGIPAATGSGGNGHLICSLLNSGSVPIQIVRVWFQDDNNRAAHSSTPVTIVLNPGDSIIPMQPQGIPFTQPPGGTSGFSLRLYFVTSRGNVVYAHTG